MSATADRHYIDAIERAGPPWSPFALANEAGYRRWREAKLAGYPDGVAELMVSIRDPEALTEAEGAAIRDRVRRANMVIYVLESRDVASKASIRALGAQLGLERLDSNLCADEDSITSLRVMPGGPHAGYIPYSNRALNWHTDGYYNPPGQQIRAILMHCVSPAAEGGENALLDHEMVYLQMRDDDPELVSALMAPDVMTIPPNSEGGEEIRGEQSGPVFSIDPVSGDLHMRYTARKRNIRWKDDARSRAAVAYLERLLSGDSAPIFNHRLEPGQGVLCNNVLHNRSAFRDTPGQERLHYRARYYDRIAGTGVRSDR
jgi:alpha-ketoglutarate-dependent taurine dioxygenase